MPTCRGEIAHYSKTGRIYIHWYDPQLFAQWAISLMPLLKLNKKNFNCTQVWLDQKCPDIVFLEIQSIQHQECNLRLKVGLYLFKNCKNIQIDIYFQVVKFKSAIQLTWFWTCKVVSELRKEEESKWRFSSR